MQDSVIPIAIDDPNIKSDVVKAIEDAATFLPTIPYLGGKVVTAKGLGAVGKAVKKGYLQVAFFMSSFPAFGASFDSEKGPLILLPTEYQPGNIFYRSIAVHEAIHRAVDGAGYQGAFQISNFENEYVAHLGQACYAIQKKANLNKGNFKKVLMAEAEGAAKSLLKGKQVSDSDRKKLLEAIKSLYTDYSIKCNGWWKSDH